MDPLAQFKESQKQGWAHFTPLEMFTTPAAAHLVAHANIAAGQRVLDVACGTGVVAVTAARLGAQVSALDLTPQLLERARENAELAGVRVEWREGDAEQLPFEDAAFDAVLSQYGHMFAPRPEVAVSEMLRVLKPGGTIAFSTWPPELFVGRTFMPRGALRSRAASRHRAAATVGRPQRHPRTPGKGRKGHRLRSPTHARARAERIAPSDPVRTHGRARDQAGRKLEGPGPETARRVPSRLRGARRGLLARQRRAAGLSAHPRDEGVTGMKTTGYPASVHQRAPDTRASGTFGQVPFCSVAD